MLLRPPRPVTAKRTRARTRFGAPLALLLVLPALAGSLAASEIYRSVDADGNVIFTDHPSEGAERVHVDPAPPLRMEIPQPAPRPTPQKQEQEAEAATPDEPAARPPVRDGAVRYDALTIAAPEDQSTVAGGEAGVLTVALQSDPPLAPGDTVTILVDGKPVISNSSGTRHAITGIEAGVHDIQALITRGEQTLIQSDTHRFLFLHE